MKLIKYIIPITLVFFLFSCSNNDDLSEVIIDETAELLKVQDLSNDTHTVEVYTKTGMFVQGYNNVFLRVKDIATNNYVENAAITWKPVMHMTSMMHSCPISEVNKVENMNTLYSGYIIFQMAENASEGWSLTLDYTINGNQFTVTKDVSVPASAKKTVSVFLADGVKYIVSLVSPDYPEVGINNFVVSVHRMETMMSFPVIENFFIAQDPRMPSMGNHSSPNNTDLSFDAASKMYKGDLSLTMTGYWKLNLMLYNDANELVKGEAVTDTNEGSSLYLEVEF